jgi:hypothetical protein
LFRSTGVPLLDLATPEGTSEARQRKSLDLLGQLNREHLAQRPGESELAARIESYELAYRMQTSAAEVVDLGRESEATREMYGLNQKVTADFGTEVPHRTPADREGRAIHSTLFRRRTHRGHLGWSQRLHCQSSSSRR